MNWRPALIAALVVIVAGAAVGVAVGRGGRTGAATVTRTVAVTETVPVTATTDTTATATTDATDTGETTPTVPVSSKVQYLSELTDDAIDDNLSTESPPTATIGHASFENAVTVDSLWESDCSLPATIEYPVQSRTATFVASLGWTQDSDSSAAAIFELHANTIDGTRLYRHVFDGPGEPAKVVLPLHAAIKAILVWRPTNDACDSPSATFVLGNARFVG
jgi:hypothetical protein